MTRMELEYRYRAKEPSDISAHLATLYEIVTRYDKPRVIELGVRFGNSTSALLAGVEKTGGHLWSVDIEPPRVPFWWLDSGLWTLTVGDDRDPAIIEVLPECDVLFIDTSHTFDHTLEELTAYVPKVKPGGVVLLHDTEYEPENGCQVARALDQFAPGWVNIPGSFGLGMFHRDRLERAA
jgi:predicted O-methyltransferase YrrM